MIKGINRRRFSYLRNNICRNRPRKDAPIRNKVKDGEDYMEMTSGVQINLMIHDIELYLLILVLLHPF